MVWAQAAPGVDPVQWHAVVQNDVAWQLLAGLILAGSALLSYGVHSVFRRWRRNGWVGARAPFYAEATVYAATPALGAFAGWLVWHWGLGLLAGLVGGWASPWVIRRLDRLLGNGKGKVDE